MFNRISGYFDVPIYDQPVSLFKIGLGIGFGWFTAAAIIQFVSYLCAKLQPAVDAIFS